MVVTKCFERLHLNSFVIQNIWICTGRGQESRDGAAAEQHEATARLFTKAACSHQATYAPHEGK